MHPQQTISSTQMRLWEEVWLTQGRPGNTCLTQADLSQCISCICWLCPATFKHRRCSARCSPSLAAAVRGSEGRCLPPLGEGERCLVYRPQHGFINERNESSGWVSEETIVRRMSYISRRLRTDITFIIYQHVCRMCGCWIARVSLNIYIYQRRIYLSNDRLDQLDRKSKGGKVGRTRGRARASEIKTTFIAKMEFVVLSHFIARAGVDFAEAPRWTNVETDVAF